MLSSLPNILTLSRILAVPFLVLLLWDAHSIASRLPRLFDGQLPDLNLGTVEGKSCDPSITAALGALLAGQSADYLRRRLREWRAGPANGAPPGVMNFITRALGGDMSSRQLRESRPETRS